MRKVGSKEKIRQYLLSRIGQVVTARDIQEVVPDVTEWARRLRELREDEGWPIVSHNDASELKPGQYILTGPPPAGGNLRIGRNISARLRAEVLDRNGFTCQMCGLTPGNVDPETGRMVRLHIGHIVDKSLGGKEELSNLRALCSTCNQGAKNITSTKPPGIWLLSQIRRAGIDEQRAAYEWLRKKFGG